MAMGSTPPPNGGPRAWLRVAAYAVACFGTLGVQYAFSPLYALLLEELGSSPAPTAFVGSLSTAIMDGSGALSGVLIERYGSRRVCLAGAVCHSAFRLYASP